MKTLRFGLVSLAAVSAASLAFANPTVNATIGGNGQNNGYNDITLNNIFFSSSEIYTTFLGPKAVTSLTTGGSSVNNGLRVVAGKNTTGIADKVMVLNDGGSLTGDEVSNSTFRNQVKDAFNSKNLNWFFDSWVSDPHFSMTLDFSNAPLQNKVFITERGSGGSNSKFTLRALDSSGNAIGNAVLVDPANRHNTGFNGAVYSQGKSPTPNDWKQEISLYDFDVKDFGVSSISFIRVTTPNVGLSGGQDIQPDFKLFGSAAPVPEPGTMIAIGAGAALLAARRRRNRKA